MPREDCVPLVSFIIPLHNRAAELPRTLDALLAQTSDAWEAIVVDDHSTDGAADVARAYASRDPRFNVIALPDPKRGAPAARNLGVASAAGAFVIFLDSDDLVMPTCVERRVAFMLERPTLDFAVARCQLFRDQPGDVPLLWNSDTGEDDLDRLLKMDVPWQTTSPIWRRSSLATLAWDESVPSGQDWEFHIRAVASGLRHERIDGEVDCFWRVAGPTRESIGKATFLGTGHVRARPAVIAKMAAFVEAAGRMTPRRRRWFDAMAFRAAEALADRVSRKAARAMWRERRNQSGLTDAQFRQANRYLMFKRWPTLAARKRVEIARTWPADLLIRRGKFFNRAPVDPARPPTISVVMSAFNNAEFVDAAIESVLGQSFFDFELIVIDDGSTDGTGELLQQFADSDCRVRLIRRENRGLTVSLNEGLALARGEFVARMDADDVALRDRFERQLACLRAHADCVLLGSAVTLIDPCGVEVVRGGHVAGHDAIDAALLAGEGSSVYHPSTMMRRDALARVGGYRPDYNGAEDLDLFLRLAEVGRVENLPDALLQYRIHPKSVNATKHERQYDLVQRVIADARARRGMPPAGATEKWTPEPIERQRHRWAWNALKRGRRDVARTHAWHAFRDRPFGLANWKLLACAVRGR